MLAAAPRWLRILSLAALLHTAALGVAGASAKLAPPSGLAPPGNVSGTYRGIWTALQGSSGPPLTPWVAGANGSVLCVLTTRESGTAGVHDVKGDVLLAASGAAAEVRLAAEGLYVPQTGELRLLVLRSHVLQDLLEEERGTPAFSRAQAGAAMEAAKLAAGSHSGRRHPPRLSQQARGENSTGLRRGCDFEFHVKLPPQQTSQSWRSRTDVRLLGQLASPSCQAAVMLNATRLNTAALIVVRAPRYGYRGLLAQANHLRIIACRKPGTWRRWRPPAASC